VYASGVHSDADNFAVVQNRGYEMRIETLNYFSAVALGGLALSGCATTAQTKSDGINVALGQTASVDGPRIKPVAVLEDSRCPINARCVWAGRVRVKVLWLKPSGNKEIELILGEAKPMADGSITLTAVMPDKVTTKEIKPGDYRFSFSFAGGL
jgi:hypothetical protein